MVSYVSAECCEYSAVAEAASIGYWRLFWQQCSLYLQRSGGAWFLRDGRGSFYGGTAEGNADFLLEEGDPRWHYAVSGAVENADFRRLVEAIVVHLTAKDGYRGTVGGWLQVEGQAGEGLARTVDGAGYVRVRSGNIFRIPLFGGLSDRLARIVPGVAYILRQTDVTKSFDVPEGRIQTDDLRIEGDVLSLKADGEMIGRRPDRFRRSASLLEKEGPLRGRFSRRCFCPSASSSKSLCRARWPTRSGVPRISDSCAMAGGDALDMRVHIRTYGCQMNERDSEAVAMSLRRHGYDLVEAEGEADLVLLNSCSVRGKAEDKVLGKLRLLAASAPVGCASWASWAAWPSAWARRFRRACAAWISSWARTPFPACPRSCRR